MKKILITRQSLQNHELESYLQNHNCQVFCEPLFKIEEIFNENDWTKYQNQKINAIVITSQNSIKTLKKFCEDLAIKDIKFFAVGKKTAKKLQELGFKNIAYPQINSAKELSKLVKRNLEDKSGLILYFRGKVISYDLKNSLNKSGYNCQEIIAYQTIANKKFSNLFLKNLGNFSYDQILIFSKKSLELFFLLAKKDNLLEYFAKSSLIVFSQKIADCAEELTKQNFKFKKIEKFSDNIILKNFYD
jgi:uroporphyrinogen-III synthase